MTISPWHWGTYLSGLPVLAFSPAPQGRIRAKSLVSAAVANAWDNMCGMAGTCGSLSCQLQPRDPEIRGSSHV